MNQERVVSWKPEEFFWERSNGHHCWILLRGEISWAWKILFGFICVLWEMERWFCWRSPHLGFVLFYKFQSPLPVPRPFFTIPHWADLMAYIPPPRAASNQSCTLIFYISFSERGSSLNLSQIYPYCCWNCLIFLSSWEVCGTCRALLFRIMNAWKILWHTWPRTMLGT